LDRQKETTLNSVSPLAQALQEILNEHADSLARSTQFVQREREINGRAFAQSLIFGWLQDSETTVDGLTQILQRYEVKISGSGLSQRFGPQSAQFLQAILQEITQKQMASEPVPIELLQRFSEVWLEDSSSIALPEQLTQVWRGCGGSTGTSEAALKLFVRWDVLHGTLQGPVITDGRHSDKRSPLALDTMAAGSLLIADLGFWDTGRFEQIVGRRQPRRQRRYLLSRLQSGVKLRRRNGAAIELRGILPQRVGERREMGAVVGPHRLPVRVLIERVPREVGEQRRKQIQENAQDHGRKASAEVLYLADWTIVITNIPARLLRFDEALVLLRLRWQIERLFRLWKEYGHIDETRSKSPWRILTEIYSKLAAMVIQQWLIQQGSWQDPHRSLFKAAQVVRREGNLIMWALRKGGLEEVLHDIVNCMGSGCRQQTRALYPSTAQFLLGEPHRWPVRKELAARLLLT
jgi:Transposase DDE domain